MLTKNCSKRFLSNTTFIETEETDFLETYGCENYYAEKTWYDVK